MLGLQLLLVGMLTVYLILVVVIFFSRLLIRLLNRFVPAEDVPKKVRPEEIPMDVLQQAVAQITGGSGRIVKVTKVS